MLNEGMGTTPQGLPPYTDAYLTRDGDSSVWRIDAKSADRDWSVAVEHSHQLGGDAESRVWLHADRLDLPDVRPRHNLVAVEFPAGESSRRGAVAFMSREQAYALWRQLDVMFFDETIGAEHG